MNDNRRHTLSIFFLLAMALSFGGCSQEETDITIGGTLKMCLGHVSHQVETRATPTQLGKPLAEDFNLRINRGNSDVVLYEGEFVESLELRAGLCDITAYYGENVPIGKDTPYYEGTATAEIEKDKVTSVTIPCRVANALVSVVYGSNEVENCRFDKFYSEYGLIVRVGDYSLTLTGDEMESSIYFPAGSSPTLIFYGTLRDEDDRLVWCELSSEALPKTFNAADHAIVTLNLPDPESAIYVDIAKVEVVTAMLDETIPLSWLPVSSATAQHHYDDAGYLVGTDVVFSNSYPGMQWKAVVTNAAGVEVRSVTGTGELHSNYDSASEWAYLPSGEYKATYYIINGDTADKIASREFTIGKPALEIFVDGYSSYTKFLEGDIRAANNCERKTIYSPLVQLNVSESLLAQHDYTFTYTFAGNTSQVPKGVNTYYGVVSSNLDVSLTPYRLRANASFDGVSVESYKDFYITGLPVTYAPPTQDRGWIAGTDYVTFSENEVKLGERGWLTAHYDEYIYNVDFAIPQHTVVTLDYDIMIRPATEGTTLTISVGQDFLLDKREPGGVGDFDTYPDQGTSTVELSADALEVKCLNSYGGSMTYSCIYSLALKYGEVAQ